MLTLTLSLALLGVFISVLSAKDLLLSSIMSTLGSLFAVLLYVLLSANDVAITEAAVGSAISSIFLLISISYVEKRLHRANQNNLHRYLAIFASLCIFIILSVGFLLYNIKEFTTSSLQLYNAMSEYIARSRDDFGIKNIVTSILGGYRGFDTLFETTVIVVATLGIYNILHNE